MDLDSLRPHRRRSSGAQQPAHTDFRPWGRRSGTFAQSWYTTGHRRWTASRRPSGQAAPQRTFTTAVRPARWRQPTQAPASPKLQSKDGRLPDHVAYQRESSAERADRRCLTTPLVRVAAASSVHPTAKTFSGRWLPPVATPTQPKRASAAWHPPSQNA